jgi:hypothetical protein
MSIVYVNNWNGYNGGIFSKVEDAIEDMAIMAIGGGIEAHKDWIEDFELNARGLGQFAGNRNDWNHYAIVNSDQEMYTISTHDTETRPGRSSPSVVVLDDTMVHPAWAVQKALYDYIDTDWTDEHIREMLEDAITEQVETARHETNTPEAALAMLRGNWSTFGNAVHSKLFEGADKDPGVFMAQLPQRALEIYEEIVSLTANNSAAPING